MAPAAVWQLVRVRTESRRQNADDIEELKRMVRAAKAEERAALDMAGNG